MEKFFLTGWKEIGTYLGVIPKTDYRYHKEFGMPALRLSEGNGQSIPVTLPDLIKG